MITIKMTKDANATEIMHNGQPIAGIAAIEVHAIANESTAADCLVYVDGLEATLPDDALSAQFTDSIVDNLHAFPPQALRMLAAQLEEIAAEKDAVEKFRAK